MPTPATTRFRNHTVSLLALVLGCAEPASAPVTVETPPAADVVALLGAATELESAGDVEGALAKAEAALIGGGGREAAVTVAKLAILLERYDRAASVLGPLIEQDPKDAVAQYDLALIYQRRNDYNRARSGYLAALRAAPDHADARFNLALLCWNKGVHEEARHHADKFRELFSADPRGEQLATVMGPRPAARPATGP